MGEQYRNPAEDVRGRKRLHATIQDGESADADKWKQYNDYIGDEMDPISEDDRKIHPSLDGSFDDLIQRRHVTNDTVAEVSRWDVAYNKATCEGERDLIRVMREVSDIMDSSRQVPRSDSMEHNTLCVRRYPDYPTQDSVIIVPNKTPLIVTLVE
jgi:hypothetical protein